MEAEVREVWEAL
ncbi:hypothetical protein RDI58_001489 [Solanum bulbocastanum]|uniref:Uncharacterized protein n=1 Tax=Solanum bulbocastanum TaxID=147425 RepID=A0AAN8UBZ2_SOLBU